MSLSSRLGRGLDALIPGMKADAAPTGTALVTSIQPNPYQPRKQFDADELQQLGDSIKAHGLLQPLVVRKVGDGYQLIAGERRLRAAQAVGLAEVPVHVLAFDDRQTLEAALVENVQRSDLNAIEKAEGFKRYLDQFGMTQDALAGRLGVDRTTVSNLLGLLNLPAEVQDWVRAGQLSLGHAKILKGVPGADKQTALAREVIANSLSVAALDVLAKQAKSEPAADGTAPSAKAAAVEKTAHVQAIEDEMRQSLSTRVQIKLKAADKGQIVFGFDTTDDFERIVGVFRRAA